MNKMRRHNMISVKIKKKQLAVNEYFNIFSPFLPFILKRSQFWAQHGKI